MTPEEKAEREATAEKLWRYLCKASPSFGQRNAENVEVRALWLDVFAAVPTYDMGFDALQRLLRGIRVGESTYPDISRYRVALDLEQASVAQNAPVNTAVDTDAVEADAMKAAWKALATPAQDFWKQRARSEANAEYMRTHPGQRLRLPEGFAFLNVGHGRAIWWAEEGRKAWLAGEQTDDEHRPAAENDAS